MVYIVYLLRDLQYVVQQREHMALVHVRLFDRLHQMHKRRHYLRTRRVTELFMEIQGVLAVYFTYQANYFKYLPAFRISYVHRISACFSYFFVIFNFWSSAVD